MKISIFSQTEKSKPGNGFYGRNFTTLSPFVGLFDAHYSVGFLALPCLSLPCFWTEIRLRNHRTPRSGFRNFKQRAFAPLRRILYHACTYIMWLTLILYEFSLVRSINLIARISIVAQLGKIYENYFGRSFAENSIIFYAFNAISIFIILLDSTYVCTLDFLFHFPDFLLG